MPVRPSLLIAAFSLSVFALTACQSPGETKSEPAKTPDTRPATPEKTPAAEANLHKPFGGLLGKYVVKGKVNYSGWLKNAEDRATLKNYLKTLAAQNPESLSEIERKAFWINAYNAVTLDQALDRYPLKSVNFDELKDPKAKEFWNTPTTIGTKTVTLTDIENGILRPTFKDPRIHFAINCASNGCPVLQSVAFEPATLDRQLDEAATGFLNDSARGATFDEKTGTLTVSPIFKWYAADFGDVPQFVSKFRPDLAGKIKHVEFRTYDWRLNEVSGN